MKMKKILTVSVIALSSALAFSGCIRETFPVEGAITTEQLEQSSAGFDAMLKALPSSLAFHPSISYDHSDFGYHSIGLYTDHAAQIMLPCTRADRGGNPYYSRLQAPTYGFDFGPGGGFTMYLWYNYYPFIKTANDIIASAGTEEANAQYRGVAKAFRAMFYLDLARFYECLPAQYDTPAKQANFNAAYEQVKGLTVPIVTEATSEEAAKDNPRVTREELFTFIFEDLADAEVCLAEYNSPSPTYPELAAIYGLYARAYLWLGGFDASESTDAVPTGTAAYQKAIEYARKAIETSGAPITSEQEWTNITTGFNTVIPSWIWATVQSSDTVQSNLYAFAAHVCPEAAYGYGPKAAVGVSKLAYDRLSDTDFRKNLIIGPEKTYDDFKKYTSMDQEEWEELAYRAPYTNFKFRPYNGERNNYVVANAVSLPIMRIEEMYFIEMDAMANSGDEAGAKAKLMEFMATRDENYLYIADNLVDEIIFQKSIEFWGEGHLMFDMKRLDMGVVTAFEETNYPSGAWFITEGRLPWWTPSLPLGESQVNLALVNLLNPDPTYGVESLEAGEF